MFRSTKQRVNKVIFKNNFYYFKICWMNSFAWYTVIIATNVGILSLSTSTPRRRSNIIQTSFRYHLNQDYSLRSYCFRVRSLLLRSCCSLRSLHTEQFAPIALFKRATRVICSQSRFKKSNERDLLSPIPLCVAIF